MLSVTRCCSVGLPDEAASGVGPCAPGCLVIACRQEFHLGRGQVTEWEDEALRPTQVGASASVPQGSGPLCGWPRGELRMGCGGQLGAWPVLWGAGVKIERREAFGVRLAAAPGFGEAGRLGDAAVAKVL